MRLTKLKQIRMNAGLKAIELARNINLARSTLSEIENCKCDPNFRTAIDIADALNVSIYDLIGRDYTNRAIQFEIQRDKLRKIAKILNQ